MSEVLPIIGCLALFLLVLPVAAFFQARRARKEARELWAQIADVTGRIARIEQQGFASTPGIGSVSPNAPGPVAPDVAAPPPDGLGAPPAAPGPASVLSPGGRFP